MITVNTHEAKTNLSALLAAVEKKGETVVICRNGKPAALLTPCTGAAIRDRFHADPRLAGVLMEDPSAPLPPDAWPDPQP